LRKQISDAGYIVGDADEVFTKFKQRLAEKAQSVAKQPKQLANNQSSQGIGNKIFNIQIAQNILNDSKTPLLNRYARIIQRLGISVLEGINDQLHERGFRWPWEIKPIPLPTPPPSKIVPSLIITPAISPIVKYSSEVTSIVILNAPLPREVSAIPANPQETLIPIKPPGSAAKPPIEQNSISIKNTLNYNQLYLHNCIINNRQSNAGCDINQSLAPGASDVIILACDACHEIDGKDGKCVPIQHQAAWGSGDNTFHSYDIPDGTTRLIIRNMAKKYGISGGGGHDEFCVN
ncbi:hypothetical protein HY041_02975, partial [Candidatus Roizmanbacteria bacterium]|nr:hypothetical protein [Candidatus Roizmanbacteria bacterium]